jgi:non-lysosomal glucosylceramidase
MLKRLSRGVAMRRKNAQLCFCCFAVALLFSSFSIASDTIPEAAWQRPIGKPLEHPGGKKPEIKNMIDDGYWQGAPVGGFGAGTFSRSYRGEFERWHLKTGIHKYQKVPANQFSIFAKAEGAESAYAQVLATDAPDDNSLSSWKWHYPVGKGDYGALYPKSWFHYKNEQMPVDVTIEQFSPILPSNYKETSYPVAVYDWHVKNPTSEKVTVSLMFSRILQQRVRLKASSSTESEVGRCSTIGMASSPLPRWRLQE